ncbi:peptide-N-glycosidase F-related protein [Hymenobacter norwichensis]|uniref:peptide-N-glycosidase F-related protein n=1 Tax=Hymenobacter norwichensis TaxID=223903 RepID=UPI0003B33524|nr:peptide-N-glycosidase F-related protein [Hymenobacter norwichensis]
MRQPVLLLFLFFALLTSTQTWAAPGDTTRVTIFSNRHITHYGDFDTTAVLPAAGRYSKIRLHYVLGRYACEPGTQYCGSWDYTTQVLVLPPSHDTLEIARVITPYASDWLQQNRKHDYAIDVTDYASVLKGTRTMRYRYDGYSWGFSLTMYLEYIEGTPPRDALDATNVYSGYFPYGRVADPIENHLLDKPVAAATGAASAQLKSIVTGHGADPSNCAEFCNFSFDLLLDNNLVRQHPLWRNNCGLNQVYPQTGTWIYNRANWCPGNAVDAIYDDLGALPTAGSPARRVNINMPAYQASNQTLANAGYYWHTQLVSYSAPNFVVDAALEDIIVPTNNENYFRENPACDAARVLLRNTGSTALTSATIRYRIDQRTWQTYTWTGNLAFLAQTEVTLPVAGGIISTQAVGTFEVNLVTANGQPDANTLNNTQRSKFLPNPVLPANVTFSFTTNNNAQTTWQLFDAQNQVVSARTGVTRQTTYNDVQNLGPGCYRLVINDTGCDGLSWWANPNAGSGSFRLLTAVGGSLIRTFNPDFGCQYVYRFNVSALLSTQPGLPESSLKVFPNPSADGRFTLDWHLSQRQTVGVRVLDVTGRVAHTATLTNVQATAAVLDLHQLPAGFYTLECTTTEGVVHRSIIIE